MRRESVRAMARLVVMMMIASQKTKSRRRLASAVRVTDDGEEQPRPNGDQVQDGTRSSVVEWSVRSSSWS